MNQNTGHVTVMRSFDYCHFEVCLPLPEGEVATYKLIDSTRKTAARLVDKAIQQYKRSKDIANLRAQAEFSIQMMRKEVAEIKSMSEQDRTPDQKAQIKALADYDYWSGRDFNYDYDDEN